MRHPFSKIKKMHVFKRKFMWLIEYMPQKKKKKKKNTKETKTKALFLRKKRTFFSMRIWKRSSTI